MLQQKKSITVLLPISATTLLQKRFSISSVHAWQKSHDGSGRRNLPPPQSHLRGDFSENCVKSVGHLLDINYEEEQEGGLGALFAVWDETRQSGRHLVQSHLTNKDRPTCLPVQLSSY